jgi:GDP-D-mannose dehydratase
LLKNNKYTGKIISKIFDTDAMKALIFGANGQDGHYLHSLCEARGIETIGVSRSGNWVRGDVVVMKKLKN